MILSKMSGYVKTFKVKDRDKDTNNNLTSFRIDDEKLLEIYKIIWTKIEDLKNIELNSYQSMMTDKKKLKYKHMVIKFILNIVV